MAKGASHPRDPAPSPAEWEARSGFIRQLQATCIRCCQTVSTGAGGSVLCAAKEAGRLDAPTCVLPQWAAEARAGLTLTAPPSLPAPGWEADETLLWEARCATLSQADQDALDAGTRED